MREAMMAATVALAIAAGCPVAAEVPPRFELMTGKEFLEHCDFGGDLTDPLKKAVRPYCHGFISGTVSAWNAFSAAQTACLPPGLTDTLISLVVLTNLEGSPLAQRLLLPASIIKALEAGGPCEQGRER
jgi:hypothetical protein